MFSQVANRRAAALLFVGRAQLVASHPFVLATELRMKTPTGYDRPSGTFGARPTSAADFLANVTTYARPDNVSDDVTLGDGQLDLSATVLVGVSLGPRVFLRADGGYVLRFGGAGDHGECIGLGLDTWHITTPRTMGFIYNDTSVTAIQ
jgi:hypothetical protein